METPGPDRLTLLRERLENPVVVRELRARMRGGRPFLVTGVYTLVVAACVVEAYYLVTLQAAGTPDGGASGQLGRQIWMWGALAQSILLPLVVPAFTCGAVTLERERHLLELLLLTRQSGLKIALGKLGPAVGLGWMLLLASVPALLVSSWLGGVSPQEVTASVLLLASQVLLAACFGLAVSTLVRKTSVATVVTYMVTGFALAGMPVLSAFMSYAGALQQMQSDWGILVLLAACFAAGLVPATLAAVGLHGLWKRAGRAPLDRSGQMLLFGLCWAGLLGMLNLPGGVDLILHAQVLMVLHPTPAVVGLFGAPGHWYDIRQADLWWICALAYATLSAWLFMVALLRITALRLPAQ